MFLGPYAGATTTFAMQKYRRIRNLLAKSTSLTYSDDS